MSKTKAVLCVVVATAMLRATGPAAAAGDETKIGELFEASFAYETTYNLDRALNSVLQVLRLAPDDYVANLRAGWLYYSQARYADSIKFYKKAIRIERRAIEPKLGMMLPLMATKAWKEAEVLAKEVLAAAPRNYTAGSRLAFIYFSQGKSKQAQQQYDKVLADFPSDLEMMLGLGWTYVKQGRTKEARAAFERVLRIRPRNINAQSGMHAVRAAAGTPGAPRR